MSKLDSFLRIEKVSAIVLGILFVLLAGFNLFLDYFTVDAVYVEGNQHYTAAQIRSIIQDGYFGDNSLFLSLKYADKSITDVPFVEKMDVDVVDNHTVKVTVYEKKLAGYVSYLGEYIYFDKDGIVVESSNVKTGGIPLVSGLLFDHFVMYEALPVENKEVFQIILNITQLLNKYELSVDKIYFDEAMNITLYFGKVRVGLGQSTLLEEKINELNAILPNIKGESGYLEMGTYDNGNEDFTFTFD